MQHTAMIMDDLARAAQALRQEWISAREMEKICATCAESMKAKNISRVKASIVIEAIKKDFMKTAYWDKLPDGWTHESVKKFWNSLEGKHQHKVTDCIKQMTKHFGKSGAGGFCGGLRDEIEGKTIWRGPED